VSLKVGAEHKKAWPDLLRAKAPSTAAKARVEVRTPR